MVNRNSGGDYLIRRVDDVFAAPEYQNSTSDEYQEMVNLLTTYAGMLVRLAVRQDTTEEINTLNRYQNASILKPIERETTRVHGPGLQSTALGGELLGIESPAQQLEFAARLLPYNQPDVYTERYRVASILSQAGLYNGHCHPLPNVNLAQAAAIANASISADIERPHAIRQEGNDWRLLTPAYQGN